VSDRAFAGVSDRSYDASAVSAFVVVVDLVVVFVGGVVVADVVFVGGVVVADLVVVFVADLVVVFVSVDCVLLVVGRDVSQHRHRVSSRDTVLQMHRILEGV
jgi:hypothetical protein